MGPLHGVKVVELAGIGPGPFAGMLLSDMGAEVVRVERRRARSSAAHPADAVHVRRARPSRHRRRPEAPRRRRDACCAWSSRPTRSSRAFRPGVTERLGLGPDACLARNPRLVYGRMTGWGQDGPLAHAAGHDINYISLAGALAHFGRAGRPPTPPLNMVGDYGGGGMFLAFGIVCAVLEARDVGRRARSSTRRWSTARPYLMAPDLGLARHGPLDRGARAPTCSTPARPSTTCTRPPTASGSSIGSIEPQFYARAPRAHRRRSTTTCRSRWTAPAGRCCGNGSPRSFKAEDARRVDAICSKAPTCASRRCSR